MSSKNRQPQLRIALHGAVGGALGLALITMGAPPVFAAAPPDDVLSILENVGDLNEENSPMDVLADVASVDTDSVGAEAIQTSVGKSNVTIPTDPSDPLMVESDSAGENIGIKLPFGDEAQNAVVQRKGIVSYDNGNGTVTAPIVKREGSVQITTIIHEASAPTRFSYDFSLPTGTHMSLDESGGVQILDEAGERKAGIAPAWAEDAAGQAVETHYEVADDVLVQVVNHTENSVTYPVVADPFLGIAIISSVTRDYDPTLGAIYRVRPTAYGRAAGDPIHAYYGWPEAVSKGVPNRNNLRDQYICHPFSVVARAKSTWNLDYGRPDVGFAATVRAGCNP